MDTYRTNVMGQYFMSMAFLPLLAKGRDITPGYTSSVVNVSSISGAMKGSSNGQFAYSSSKAAFTHLSRMLATTFKDTKVRVSTLTSHTHCGASMLTTSVMLGERNCAGRFP